MCSNRDQAITYMTIQERKPWKLVCYLQEFLLLMAVVLVDHTLHGLLQCVQPTLTDQLVGQVLAEVINSSLALGPNTWLQPVLLACK